MRQSKNYYWVVISLLIGLSFFIQASNLTINFNKNSLQTIQNSLKPKSADVTQIPTSPVDLQITLGAEENTITWDAPYITGGSILGYNIYRGSAIDSMQLIQSVSNSPLSASDTPPQSGIYYYYITATNSLGESLPSNIVCTSALETPTSPVDLQLTSAVDGQITFSWVLPPSSENSPLENMKIYRGSNPNALICINTVSLSTTYTEHVDYGIYYYYVTVTNSFGESLPSNEINATYLTIPQSPTNLNINQQGNKIYFSWKAPSITGGAPLMSYELSKTFNDGSQNYLTTVPSYQTSYLDYITTAGTYTYSISAKNVIGLSTSNSISIFYQTLPTAPLNLTLIAIPTSSRNIQINLTWNAPSIDGGNAISAYKVYRSLFGQPATFDNYGSLAGNFTEILSQTGDYCYYVTAVTTFGEGPHSNEVEYTFSTTPMTISGLTAQIQGYAITLTWNPPDDIGNNGIIGYQIFRGNKSSLDSILEMEYYAFLNGTQTSFIDANVTVNAYYYEVIPVNSLGVGLPSSEIEIWYDNVPTAPLDLTLTSTDSDNYYTIELNWNAPASDGGFPISGYDIYKGYSSGSETLLDSTTNTYYLDSSSDQMVSYYYVQAVNKLSNGTSSNEASTVYQPPSSLTINWGGTYALIWSPPACSGGSPVIEYKIYTGWTRGLETLNTIIPASGTLSFNPRVAGLAQYTFVTAVNAAGESLRSNEEDSPTNLVASQSGNQITLTWSPSDVGVDCTYGIYRGNEINNVSEIATTANTQYTDVIPSETSDYYMVSCIYQPGSYGGPEPGFSNAVFTESLPSSPLNLHATDENNMVHLQWISNEPANPGYNWTYNIYRGTAHEEETYLTTIAGNFTDFYDIPDQPGTYYYQVTAVNTAGESTNPNEAMCVFQTVPNVPQGVNITVESETQISLNWATPLCNGGSDITAYNIYRSIDNSPAYLLNNCSSTQLSYTDTLSENGTFTYYITALNQNGESLPSINVTWSYLAIPSDPQFLMGNDQTNVVNLTWGASLNDSGSPITQYLIYRGTSSFAEIFLANVSASMYTLGENPLNPGQTLQKYQFQDTPSQNGVYFYYVVAQNNNSQSLTSNEISVDYENSPLLLVGDDSLAAYPYKMGLGTQADPYLIEGLNFTQMVSPVTLVNTTSYVDILNGDIVNCTSGISLIDCQNVLIQNVQLENITTTGILIQSNSIIVQNISITNNLLVNNSIGINIGQNCSNLSVNSNQLNLVGIGIESTSAVNDSERMIGNNSIINFLEYGIYCNSNGADQLINNTFWGNFPDSDIGIFAINSQGGILMKNNFLANCSIGTYLSNGTTIPSYICNSIFVYCNQSFIVIENMSSYQVQDNTFLFNNEQEPFVLGSVANFSSNYYSNYQKLYPQATLNGSYYSIPYVIGSPEQVDNRPLITSPIQTQSYFQPPMNLSINIWNWELNWRWIWQNYQLDLFRQYSLSMNNALIAQGYYQEAGFNLTLQSANFQAGNYTFTLIISNGLGPALKSIITINYILLPTNSTIFPPNSTSSSNPITTWVLIGIIGAMGIAILTGSILISKRRKQLTEKAKKETPSSQTSSTPASTPVSSNSAPESSASATIAPEYAVAPNKETGQKRLATGPLTTSQFQIRNNFAIEMKNIALSDLIPSAHPKIVQLLQELNLEKFTTRSDASETVMRMILHTLDRMIESPMAHHLTPDQLLSKCVKVNIRTFIGSMFIQQFLAQIEYSPEDRAGIMAQILKDLLTRNPSNLVFSDDQVLTSILAVLPDTDISQYISHPSLSNMIHETKLDELAVIELNRAKFQIKFPFEEVIK